MGRLAQSVLEERRKKDEEVKSSKSEVKVKDWRTPESKIFDALNPFDSGRSYTTAEPSEENKKKSVKEQAGDTAKKLGEDYAPFVRTVSGENTREQERLGKSVEQSTEARNTYTKQLRDGKIDQERYDALIADLDKQDKKTEDAKKEVDKDDTRRVVSSAATAGLDLATAGVGGAAAKAGRKVAEEGGTRASRLARTVIDESKKGGTINEGAKLGATSGATSAGSQEEVTPESLATSALLGAGAGAGIPALGLGAGAASTALKPLDERGAIANPFRIKARIGDDLQSEVDRGRLDSKIESARADDLQLGSDTNTGLDLDPNTVQSYKDRIKNGEEIDPVVVMRGEDGQDYVQDGAHKLQAAKELGVQDIPIVRKKDNVVMAEKVTPPTEATLSEPVQLRVLDDLGSEARTRSTGDETINPPQIAETKAQKGAQFLVDDTDRLAKETGIDVVPLDRRTAEALTGKTKSKNITGLGRDFKDTLTVGGQTLGRPGVDFTHNLLKGNKFKRDALDALHDPMVEIQNISKRLIGTGFRKRNMSTAAKEDLGARIGAALDDRENAATYLRNADEQALYDNFVKVFDYVKNLREKGGLETLENYRPWVDMQLGSEPPLWLADSLTNNKVQTLSRFSKERTKTEAGENVDNNLIDMIYGYVNSQLNEMAYDAPVRKFKSDIENLPAAIVSNKQSVNEGIEYFQTLIKQAVSPGSKNELEKFIANRTSNVYGAILPFNLKLALQNKTQKFIANSRVSKGAQRLANDMDESDLKDLEKGMVFGNETVYGELENVNASVATKKGVREKLSKVDPYQRSEQDNVVTSYRKGAAQAILESEPYKAAIKSGSSKKEAAKIALQDPQVRELAVQRGNTVVNDTQFGASALARPAALRKEGSVLGIPIKSLTMLTRFPIGMSQHILEGLKGSNARALDILKNGDPRAVPITEMRSNYKALLDQMKDSKSAIDSGTDIGIPKETLNEQINTVSKNLRIIDKEMKKYSQIRGGKTTKNLAKMWAAAAAIQVIFDGGLQSFMEDPESVGGEALLKSNPTATGKVIGQNSVLSGLSSAASPVNKYGGINTRAVTNAIPVVGTVANRGRDINKLLQSLTGSSEEQ